MAVFKLKDENLWMPQFARGKNLTVHTIRVQKKDGTKENCPINGAGANRTIVVTDDRAIRHLEVDPRFTRIS